MAGHCSGGPGLASQRDMPGARQTLLSTDTGSNLDDFTTGLYESFGLLFNGLGCFY
jgi:hypothetical protein